MTYKEENILMKTNSVPPPLVRDQQARTRNNVTAIIRH